MKRCNKVKPILFDCVSCRERFGPWPCMTCGADIFTYCRECHAEVKHGRIGPPPGYVAIRHEQQPKKWHEDEDMNRRSDE